MLADPPVLTMVAAFSGFIMAVVLPSRTTGDLLSGMWQLLSGLGSVPKILVWDNESGIGQHHRLTTGARSSAQSALHYRVKGGQPGVVLLIYGDSCRLTPAPGRYAGLSAERLAACIELTPIRAEPWTAVTSDFPRVAASAAAGHAWRPSRWPPRPRR